MTDAASADAFIAPGWPENVGRVIHDSLGSTNAEALRIAPDLTRPVWVLARQQTHGRGRRGRGWVGAVGNFSASLALPDAGPPAEAAKLTFVAALALHDVLAGLVGPLARVAIKWPNDVLLNGGKISGILLEGMSGQGTRRPLAVGIGVNLVAAPPPEAVEIGAVAPVALRDVLGDVPTPEEFLTLLAVRFSHWQQRLQTQGFIPLREAWLIRAARLGQVITARTPRLTRSGRFEGIDGEGALILITENGRETIPAADIHF